MDDRRRNVITAAVIAGQELWRAVYENIVEESSGEDDVEVQNFMLECQLRLRGPSQKPPRIEGFVGEVIPRFNSKQFREHYRKLPSTFEILENRLGPVLQGINDGKKFIPVRTQLLASVWLLATPDCYRSVGVKHDLAKSSLSVSVRRVVSGLVDMAGEVIKWPVGDRLEVVKGKFQQCSNMPNVIGAVDGTDVNIKAPKDNILHYKTRKRTYAIVLQAICDASLVFTDCFAGYPGSVGDCRIFKNSDLYREAQQNVRKFFPNNEYIVGDKAYPVLSWCVPPYRENGRLKRVQKRFNTILSKTRQVIERTFALLKGRFRRLKYLDMERVDLIPDFILAACVLHNICLVGLDGAEVEHDDVEDFIDEGLQIQQEQIRENNEAEDNAALGIAKRLMLTNLLAGNDEN